MLDPAAQSDALRLDFILQPGDIQLLHNHQMLHTRAALLCADRSPPMVS